MEMYRPYSWQQSQMQRLENAIEHRRLPHAILFSGTQGIGKCHLADCLVYTTLKKHSISDNFKTLLDAGTHPDVHHILLPDDKKQIGVDQIRDLSEQLSLTPQLSEIKIAIIQPAELMNRNAANALLKTLEEPAGNTLIILVSHNPGSLPQTIRSRCQHIPLNLPTNDEATAWLNGQGIENSQAYLDLASGAPLLAKVAAENDWLGQYQGLLEDLSALTEHRLNMVSASAQWQDVEVSVLIQWLKNLVKILIQSKMNGQITSEMAGSFLKNLKISVDRIDLVKLFDYSDFLNQCEREISNNLNRELFLEQIFNRWAALSPT